MRQKKVLHAWNKIAGRAGTLLVVLINVTKLLIFFVMHKYKVNFKND